MTIRILIGAVALMAGFTMTGCAHPPALPAASVTTQLPRAVRPIHYDVAITPDAGSLTFSGQAAIAIEVLQPTRAITLNAADLNFTRVGLSGTVDDETGFGDAGTTIDAAAQSATFSFEKTIPPGRYQLVLEYTGKIATHAYGLFAIDYATAAGPQRALFTQFENADARRVIPSWDEPAFKASFTLEATVPNGQMAVSNMPVAGVEDLGGGRSRVRFAPTPKMSTYLLFFALGDFDRATVTVDGTELGVVTRKGVTDQAAFVLESSQAILREYNRYFGIPHPLPKLDQIAAPGSSQMFGAMENWGAIMTFEYAILLDPSIATQADTQYVFATAAHEISHQWIGNLVTMQWWDELWLNEGFASWIETRTTARLHPEWGTALEAVRTRERAMERDALATTHPVVQHVETVDQANQAFDSITYEKGEAVIRMLEAYVGDDAWRRGVRQYLQAHAYGNTNSEDLWREIAAAADQPVAAVARDFTLQPGVPLIRVEAATCRDARTTLRLTQGEFSTDQPAKKPLAWRVPVIAALRGGVPVRTLVTRGRGSVTVPGCGPVIVNAGQSGYYRTLYGPDPFAAIAASFASIAPIDQLGILADSWALGLAGLQPVTDFLDLARGTPISADPQVWGKIADIFAAIDDYYRGEPGRQARFRQFAIERLAPVFAQVGWTGRPGELSAIAILRNNLIETLSGLGDPAVIAEARRRYAAQRADAAAIPGPIRKSVLGVLARHADPRTWEELRAAALAETTPLVRDERYALLATAEDAGLAQRALDLALTPEPGATESAEMLLVAARLHPDLAFDFAIAHLAAVMDKVDLPSRSRYLPMIARHSVDPAMVGKIKDYAAASLPAGSRRDADTAAANVAWRIRVRAERLPAIDGWLQQARP